MLFFIVPAKRFVKVHHGFGAFSSARYTKWGEFSASIGVFLGLTLILVDLIGHAPLHCHPRCEIQLGHFAHRRLA